MPIIKLVRTEEIAVTIIAKPITWYTARRCVLTLAARMRRSRRESEKEGEKESKSSWLVPEKTLRAADCRRSIMKIPVYLLLHVDPEPPAKSNYGSRNVIDERLNLLPR